MEQEAGIFTAEATSETAPAPFEPEPEGPFLADPISREKPPLSASTAFGPTSEFESPFISEYVVEGEVVVGPQAEQYTKLLGELYDHEFEEAVTDLVNEASALAEEHFAQESGNGARDYASVEQAVREYLAPLEREANAMLVRMAEAAGERDLSVMTEGEIESLFERFEPAVAMPSPVFENFLKKLWKKAKSAVKAVGKVVSKVVPIGIVLGKLKALVRPLLERVLRFAIKKLPAGLRSAARQLARQFLGITTEAEQSAAEDPPTSQGQAAPDPAEIQEEMDSRLAGAVVQGEEFERGMDSVQLAQAEAADATSPLRQLEEARDQFAREIVALRPGQDPTPVVEHFIPAILAAAQVAIRIIGRPRVVGFLAGLVAKLIARFVGPEAATGLSRALVDTGLRLVSLESTPEGERAAAGYTVASTVEDTINRLVAHAPAEAWESADTAENYEQWEKKSLLVPYAHHAFEKAASANFPDSSIRSHLHETAEQSGAWVLMPPKGTHKRYKKYTRVVEMKLTPQMTHWVQSFGGVRLNAILGDRYGVAPGATIAARCHLYEAIRGTTLSQIAFHERGLPGLGSAGRSAWTLLHPLTARTAGALFREPGLGADVPHRFLADRNLIEVGQRFYFVEIPNVTPRQLPRIVGRSGGPAATGGRSSHTRLVFDFPAGQLRLFIYYGESDAQELKKSLLNKTPGMIPALLTPDLDIRLRAIISGNSPKQLKIVHEAVPAEQFLPQAVSAVLRMAGEKIVEWVAEWALRALRDEVERQYEGFVERFRKAADEPADGVTLAITFQGPTFFEKLRKLLASPLAAAPGALGLLGARAAAASVSVDLHSGFHYR